MINLQLRHLFYSIRNPKLETTGANTSSIKPLPSCTRTRFFVLKGTLGLPRSSKASSYGSNISLFSSEIGICPISILYKTWTIVCSCCGVAVFKRNGANKQGNQLTVEEEHDCCSLHKTLLQNELRMAVSSLL